jgi:hypothetical protein
MRAVELLNNKDDEISQSMAKMLMKELKLRPDEILQKSSATPTAPTKDYFVTTAPQTNPTTF